MEAARVRRVRVVVCQKPRGDGGGDIVSGCGAKSALFTLKPFQCR